MGSYRDNLREAIRKIMQLRWCGGDTVDTKNPA